MDGITAECIQAGNPPQNQVSLESRSRLGRRQARCGSAAKRGAYWYQLLDWLDLQKLVCGGERLMRSKIRNTSEYIYNIICGHFGFFTLLAFADPVVMAGVPHPIPSRTRPLSPLALMVLRLKARESKSLPGQDRKSTRLNSSHITRSRMPSSA
eukprot:TRINITY_DN313_c0_g1_i8.p1 TRINITY_DN313_c0_g1~~TRINITY_DN313_c0_g1_i8.p1  ORF type:complete len:154 (+),score=3.92 TRINITY_DN313_c0_g1_i8:394-855(+)